MKPFLSTLKPQPYPASRENPQSQGDMRKPPTTRFGDLIDVRNRGALRVGRFAGSQTQAQDAPAVVRLWTDEQCREMTTHQARALAAQLLAAASLAESQNSH